MKSPYLTTRDKGRHRSVHRVVMEQHLSRPLNPDEDVHHINGDKRDNRIENLVVISHSKHAKFHAQKYAEYATCVVCGKQFLPHPTNRKNGKICSIKCKRKYYRTQSVMQFSLEGNLIKIWDSVREAERELQIPHGGINACCKGKQKTCHNFIWRFTNEPD